VPTWLTTGTDSRPEIRVDVERRQAVAHGELDGVTDGGVQVVEERGGDLAQLELHRGEQPEVPELAADLVAAVGPPVECAPIGEFAQQPVGRGERCP
jgi:hypothetical protein